MAKKRKPKPRKIREYLIPDRLTPKPSKLILGCDPGSKNFGIALVGLVNGKPHCYANAVLNFPIDTLLEFNRASDEYLAEMDQWVAKDPDAIVAERFQTRGNGGPLIEQVSVMIGLLQQYGLPMKLTIASAWKNAVRRQFGLDLREDVYGRISVEPHQLDAALIGVYGLEQGTGLKLDYDFEAFVRNVEKTSLI